MFWGFGGRLNRGGYETGFSLFRGVLGATIVKPGFGELDLSNRGGFINGVLTLQVFTCTPFKPQIFSRLAHEPPRLGEWLAHVFC